MKNESSQPAPSKDKEEDRKVYNDNLTKNYPPYSGKIIGAGKSPSILKQIDDLWKHLPIAERKKFIEDKEEKTESQWQKLYNDIDRMLSEYDYPQEVIDSIKEVQKQLLPLHIKNIKP